MDQKLKQVLFLLVALFMAKIAIADPMRDMDPNKRPKMAVDQLEDIQE